MGIITKIHSKRTVYKWLVYTERSEVPPAGIEPASLVPKTRTLSVKLRRLSHILPHFYLDEKRFVA